MSWNISISFLIPSLYLEVIVQVTRWNLLWMNKDTINLQQTWRRRRVLILRNTVIPFLIGITWLCNIVHHQAWAIISLVYGISDSWLARHMAVSLCGSSRLSIWQTSGTGEFFLVILRMFLKLGIEIIMLSIFTFFNWPLHLHTIRLPSKTSVYM